MRLHHCRLRLTRCRGVRGLCLSNIQRSKFDVMLKSQCCKTRLEAMPKSRTNETGKRFGKLVVLGFLETPASTPTRYLVRCDCGVQTDVRRDNLVSGHTKSCGCQMAPSFQGQKTKSRGPAQKHAPAKRSEPRVCEACQKPFKATKQDVRRGWARFCNRKCRGKARSVPHARTTGSGPVFEIRKQSGLTQKSFAAQIGLSKSLIEKCERAGTCPRSLNARQRIEEYAASRDYKL